MARILFADDDQTAFTVLESILNSQGHEAIGFTDGASAWEALQKAEAIDVAILDWNMPGYSGLEISKMYQESDLPFIYKILISGVAGRDQLVEALHNGVHDILLKPINTALLESRVEIGCRYVREFRANQEVHQLLGNYAQHLEELAKERAKQLVHAERMSSLGVMSAGVAHEINNPMSFISGNAQLLKRFWQDLEPCVRELSPQDESLRHKLDFIHSELPKALAGIMNGVERVTTIVQGLKKYSGKGESSPSILDLNDIIRQALDFSRFSLGKQIHVETDLSPTPLTVRGNTVELEQVLLNLFVNAGHAMEGLENGVLAVSSIGKNGYAEVAVNDCGPGISEDLIQKIWSPFFTTKAPGKGTGLGLSISAGIISSLKGTISAENRTEGGARFLIRLPLVPTSE